MLKTFKQLNELPSYARVWVFPSTKTFTDEEATTIQAQLDVFLFQWAAHGEKLPAKGHILYNRFIVVMLDEKQVKASGCSIDTLTHFTQKIEKEFGTSFTDRMNINYLDDNQIKDIHLNDVAEKLTPETEFFNHLVNNKADFENSWLTTVKGSWLERYL